MSARDDLLAALLVERYTSPWWVTPSEVPDDDLTCRRRLNACVAEAEAMERARRKVG